MDLIISRSDGGFGKCPQGIEDLFFFLFKELAHCSVERQVFPESNNRLLTLSHDGCAAVLAVTHGTDAQPRM